MNYIWLFFVASFAGWVLETTTYAIKQKRFSNRGAVNMPLCILYGLALVFITVFCKELDGFWLFVGATLVATVFEWTAGHLIERLYSEKWWDYSQRKWNLDGYVCVSASLIWGALAFLMVECGNTAVIKLFQFLPISLRKIVIVFLLVMLILDIFATIMVISHRNANDTTWHKLDCFFDKITFKLGNRIYERINKRIEDAYPEKISIEKEKTKPEIFAYGLCFSKVFLLFFIGSVLGV